MRCTVVVPARDRAATIGRAIRSACDQRGVDLEVVVVDDGSVDGTGAAALAAGDDRVRVVRRPSPGGAAAARNAGVEAAAADVVAFLDSDDEWDAGKLAAQLAQLRPDVAAVVSGYRIETTPGTFVDRRIGAGRLDVAHLLDRCFVAPGTTLVVRRAAWDEVGPLEESLPRLEDWDWMLRCVERHPVERVDEPLATVYRSGWPSADAVERSAAQLWARNADRVRDLAGPAGARRLRASLELEVAMARLRHGATMGAIAAGLRAATVSPARAGAFVQWGVGKVLKRDLALRAGA